MRNKSVQIVRVVDFSQDSRI